MSELSKKKTQTKPVFLQSKSYQGYKNDKVLSYKSKQPLLNAFLAVLLHIRTVTEQNFLRAYLRNSAPLSTTTLSARDLEKG